MNALVILGIFGICTGLHTDFASFVLVFLFLSEKI